MLITPSLMLAITDKLGYAFAKLKPLLASADDSAFWPVGSVQAELDDVATQIADSGNRSAQLDILPKFEKLSSTVTIEVVAKLLLGAL